MRKLDRLHLGLGIGLLLCAALSGYAIRIARAAGIPATNTMYYTGSLLTFGVPDNSSHNMVVSLYIQGQTSSPACTSNTLSVTTVNGQFSLPLPAACVPVIHANPNVLVQLTVDGTALGMTPLGAVPYAVEADTASNAAAGSALGTLLSAVNSSSLTYGTWNATESAALTVLGNNWTAIPGASVTFTVPASATLELYADGSVTGAVAGANHCGFRFIVDGAPQGDPSWGSRLIGCGYSNAATGWWCNWSMQLQVASVTSGSHTVSLQQNGWPGTSAGCATDGGAYDTAKLHVVAHQ